MTVNVLMGMSSAVLFLVAAIAILWVGRAGTRGTLVRNTSVGIRTRWTLSSDDAWIAGHKAAARNTRIAGVGALIGSVLGIVSGFLPLFGVSETITNSIIAVWVLTACLWLLAFLMLAVKAANLAAKPMHPLEKTNSR